MTTSAEEIKALSTEHFVDWLKRYAGSLRYGDLPTNGNDIAFLEVARRLSEMDDALKSCEAWLTRCGLHIGNCRGERREDACTCGLVAIRHEARAALEHQP